MTNLNPGLLDSPGLYLTGEDNLRLTTFGSLAGAVVALEGRLVNVDGRTTAIAERQVPSSNYTSTATVFALAEGILTNVQLRISTGASIRGSVFAILEIVRGTGPGAQALGTLIQGYVTTNGRLAWPGSPIVEATSGVGRMRSITGTDPAAGAEISETVPANVRWRLMSLYATLVTSAVVANRQPILRIDDGVNIVFAAESTASIVASATKTMNVGPFGNSYGGGPGDIHIGIGERLWLASGYRLRTLTAALDPGDNWSAPQYVVEEFIEA